MPKGNRTIISLVSTANTGFYYTTTKNRRSQQERLKLHVLFEEKSTL